MHPSLNIVRSRGKWYVYTRDKTKCLLKGFVGTREDIDAYVSTNIESMISSAVENEALRIRMEEVRRQEERDKRARHRRVAALELDRITAKRCRQKGIPYEMTADQINELLAAAGDECEVSCLAFDYGDMKVKRQWHKNPLSPSLDRIDRGSGYSATNVRLVCTSVNIAINEWGLPHFLKICQSVAARDPEIVLQTDRFRSVFIG